MTGHPVLTFALLICGSVVLLLAFIAAVWALGKLWDALRRVNLRTLIWRWRRDASWRRAEREQARADAAEQAQHLALLAVASGMDGMPGGCDSRGALLTVQWAIADAAKRAEAEAEGDAREQQGAKLLKAIYEAAYELDVCEDFEMMPCQHACCAPADWNAYQATRQQLHDAIAAYRDHLGIDPWLGAVPAATTADATGSEAPR